MSICQSFSFFPLPTFLCLSFLDGQDVGLNADNEAPTRVERKLWHYYQWIAIRTRHPTPRYCSGATEGRTLTRSDQR
jgi:hypothetical protein